MTGPELKHLRVDLGDAIGRTLSAADMAKLCGLASGDGADTIRRWEVAGPSGPAAALLRILAMASDRHPILEKFNVFDRVNIPENEPIEDVEFFKDRDRKSTRLNSSHRCISYAVFCLKKKKTHTTAQRTNRHTVAHHGPLKAPSAPDAYRPTATGPLVYPAILPETRIDHARRQTRGYE